MTVVGKSLPESGVAGGSGAMFNRIAHRYDLLNRVMSMGLDIVWRRALVRSINEGEDPRRVLDLATGTGDVAMSLLADTPKRTVVGLDPARAMLEVAQDKLRRRGLTEYVQLMEGDAQALPFATDGFDACTMAFGIRNVPNRRAALTEMVRVTRPGGRVAILELVEPRGRGLLGWLARTHVHRIIPMLGAWISGWREYSYLAKSIAAFPSPEEFLVEMEESGFSDVEHRTMTFGSVCLFVGFVPQRAAQAA